MPKLYLTLVLLCLLKVFAFAQSDSTRLTTIAAKLQKQSATRPAEKAYLQFNKPAYSAGDTIWFKGYVVVGAAHQPSALSGVLYVDLIDGANKIIKSLQLKNNNGIATGDFPLDERMKPGDYRIRAYTTWMRNAPEYFFNTTIAVGDIQTNAVIVNPVYSIVNTNGTEYVNTKLAYTDKFGHPYNNREVTYEVLADTNLLYRGKGTTDAMGNLSFSFPGKTAPGQHVTVNSHFKIAGGVTVSKITPINVANDNIDIQFFPEGGQLINDVRSKVGFKAIGTNGLGADVKGVVIDNENNEVAYFSSQHAGMGVFAFTPQSGKTYTAKVTLADDLVVSEKLPVSADKGFVLAINNTDSTKLTIRVATNAATLQEKQNAAFYLIGQSGGVVYFTSAGKLDNASFNINVPKNRFPSGIAQFTLFSATNEPLNERVAFIQNNTGLIDLNLSSQKTTYAVKEKVDLSLLAKDNSGKPVLGNFSLTVFNDDITPVNENNENTILSNILLTSDLKGYIESPNYYFNKVSDKTKADLDILMLTQGYRRFEWKEILADNYAAITFKPERSLSVSGTLTASNGKPVAKGKVSAFSAVNKFAVDTTSNEQGKFNLTGLNFTDTARLVIQARKENGDKQVTIALDSKPAATVYKNTSGLENGFIPPVLSAESPKADTVQIATAIRSTAFKFNKTNDLKEVTVKQQRNNYGTENAPWMPKASPHSANLNGVGHADMIFGSKELEHCVDFVSCVINMLPGVIRGPRGYTFAVTASKSLTAPPGIKFMLDGVFTSIDNLSSLNALDVESVEVLKFNNYLNVYGTSASGGLIIITTRNGTVDINQPNILEAAPGILKTTLKGFDKTKEFYVPKYTVNNTAPFDMRDAIYWNPNIATDDKGKTTLEYFNSDVKGSYRAVIEGIDNDGNIGRFVYRYKVE